MRINSSSNCNFLFQNVQFKFNLEIEIVCNRYSSLANKATNFPIYFYFYLSVFMKIKHFISQSLQIGIWTEKNKLNISEEWMHHYMSISMQNVSLIVTTVLSSPYTMLRDSATERLGNERYEGFCIDLIEELSQILHFRYTFRLVSDKKWGNEVNGTWNGMI